MISSDKNMSESDIKEVEDAEINKDEEKGNIR